MRTSPSWSYSPLLVRRFAVPGATDDAETLLAQLQQRFGDEAHQGRTVALIIDEAQHCPSDPGAIAVAGEPDPSRSPSC